MDVEIRGLDETVKVMKEYIDAKYGFINELFSDIEDPDLKDAIGILAHHALNIWKWGPLPENRIRWLEGLENLNSPKEAGETAIKLYIERLVAMEEEK